jgi:serine phosphatase RsbU (regulator of sigma subunit)
MGISDSAVYKDSEVSLAPGDRFMLLTDGLTDISVGLGNPPLASADLRDMFLEGVDLPVREHVGQIVNSVAKKRKKEADISKILHELDDDICVLIGDVCNKGK